MTGTTTGTTERPADGPGADWWHRAVAGWHIAFVCIAAIVAVVFAQARAELPVYALLATLVVWYFLTGARALPEYDERLGRLYLAVAFLLFGALVYLEPGALGLLFALYPQTFALLSRVYLAVAATALLSVLFTVMIIAREGWSREVAVDASLQGAINLGFALVIGLFISGVVRESERRAGLIAELEATRAELAEAHHQAGVMAERERLAQEIHDTLAQGFTSMLMLVRAADAVLERDPAAARVRLALAERTARENLDEARALVAALAPAQLRDGTLVEAVGRLVSRLGEEIDVRTSVDVRGQPALLPAGTQVVLLRATQEALANVRKHAAARAVTVLLDHRADGTSLEVRDDGRGFEPAAVNGGFGLRGMRARVELAGGTVEVTSGTGAGTTVRVVVP